jgi:hypothetical protein
MKWKALGQPVRVSRYSGYGAEWSGGHHNPVKFDQMMDDDPRLWLRISNRKLLKAVDFGRPVRRPVRRRRPRPQPRTIPLVIALPVIAYLWWKGEL